MTGIAPEPAITGPSTALTGVARGGSFAALGSALGAVLGLLLTLVVTHGLTQASAGQFFTVTAVFLVAQTILSFGVGAGVVRFIPRLSALGRADDTPALLLVAFVPVAVLAAAGSVALWFVAPTLAAHLGPADPAQLSRSLRVVAALFLPATVEVAAVECTRGFGSIRRYVLIQQIMVPFLRPVLVLLATALHWSLALVVTMWLVPLLIALTLSAVAVGGTLRARFGRVLPWPQRSTSLAQIAREYWAFTAIRGTAMVMEIMLSWLDVLMVAALVSPAKAAIYAAASRFITSGTLILQALRLAIATDISAALARRDLARVSEVYRVATQWVVLSSWPLYLLMAVFAPTVLTVFGSGYDRGATAMTVLCLAMLANLAAGNVGTVLLMGGKGTWVLADKSACLALNVALNIALIPALGITGAAMSWAATIVLDGALAFSQVRWGMRVGGSLTGVLLAGALAVGSYATVGLGARLIWGSSWPVLLAGAAGATAVFAPAVWKFRAMLELAVLVNAVGRGRRAGPLAQAGSPRRA